MIKYNSNINDSYYEAYREGLIKRHITKNGRLLQEVLLVEQDISKPISTFLHDNRRVSSKKTVDGKDYIYSAYPVVVESTGGVHSVVGGGDNPMLYGSLAMATFCMEDILGVSKHSFHYATKILDYFLRIEIRKNFQRTGFFSRRKNWWHWHTEISKDELSGFMLGLHFYIKAAQNRGDFVAVKKAKGLLERHAGYLQENKYMVNESWLFQFPFSRVFKHHLDNEYLSDTIPIEEIENRYLREIVRFFAKITCFNKWYKPEHLFFNTMRFLPLINRLANFFKMERKFFNITMYMHCLLMLICTNNTCKKQFDKLWKKISKYDGKGNSYLETISMILGNREDVSSIINPMGVWCDGLPLKPLPEITGGISAATLFEDTVNGKRLIGECFTWEHSNYHGHVLKYDWERVRWRLGPGKLEDLNYINYGDISKGFYVESSGIGLLFVRMLLSYFNLEPAPKLSSDKEYRVLPTMGAC